MYNVNVYTYMYIHVHVVRIHDVCLLCAVQDCTQHERVEDGRGACQGLGQVRVTVTALLHCHTPSPANIH